MICTLRRACFVLLLPVLLPVPIASAQLLADIADREISVESRTDTVAGKRLRQVALSDTVSEPFTGVAAEFFASAGDIEASVRFLSATGWSTPAEMHLVRSATTDAVVAGWRSPEAIHASRIEVTIDVPDNGYVALGSVGIFDNRRDTDGRAVALPSEDELRPLAGAAAGSITPPPLITRAEWGAQPFKGTPETLAKPNYDYMTFHHAAGYKASNKEEGLVQLRAIQDLHQNVRGWSDIGYQFVIDRAGNLYQGRPFLTNATSLEDLPVLALGAHAGGANTGNIGICLLGCYHPPEGAWCADQITPEAYETYVTLFAFLSERYGVSPGNIYGHRDFGQTSCPGDNNYTLLPRIKVDVAELLVTGNANLGEAAMVASVTEGGIVSLALTLLADRGISGYRLERWIGEDRVVLFDMEGPLPSHWADDGLTESGSVQYRLYALSSSGRRQLLSVTDVDFDRPSAYALAEAFPNPTDGDVRIRYYLRDRGHVRVTLFDALGRQVSVLVDGFDDGEHWSVVTWPTNGMPPGVYRYRLTVEGFSGIAFDRSYPVVVIR